MGFFDKITFELNSAAVEKFYVVGSLKDSLYQADLKSKFKKVYDICLIADSYIDYYVYKPILTNLKKLMF